MAPAVLAYWDIRGLAQPIRLLLEYTGMPFEDKYYTCGPAPDYDKSVWLGEKFTHGLDFPNLPYFFDGNVKLTQRKAIMRYIGRKFNLVGKSEEEYIRMDLTENEEDDFRNNFVDLCYNPEFENLKEGYLKALPGKLEAFSKFLGTHHWFAGKNLTIVDFSMYEILDQILLLDPNCLKSFANLQEFQKRIESLDPIKKYQSSPKYLKYPLNNKMAKFGGT